MPVPQTDQVDLSTMPPFDAMQHAQAQYDLAELRDDQQGMDHWRRKLEAAERVCERDGLLS